MSKSYKRIKAVKIAGQILKHLSHQKEPLSGPEIAAALDMAEGTVMCHLATLEDMGFVQCINSRYILGRQMAFIWARVKSSLEADMERIHSDLDRLNPDNYKTEGQNAQ